MHQMGARDEHLWNMGARNILTGTRSFGSSIFLRLSHFSVGIPAVDFEAYAFSTRLGTEALMNKIEAGAHSDPELTGLSLDVAAAHDDDISREAMLAGP